MTPPRFIIVATLLMLVPRLAIAQFEGNPLSQAVDNTQFNFVTDSPGFFNQSSVANFGGDAAASQGIGDDEVATMVTEFQDVLGMGGRITFDWKVSSEAEFDFLAFLILDSNENIVARREISGDRDWATISVNIPAGDYTLAWGYVKDGSVSRGQDRGYIDRVRIARNGDSLPSECLSGSTPLNSALDTEDIVFTDFFRRNNGIGFECVEDETAVSGAAALSDAEPDDTSQVWADIEGPVDLVFNWRILDGEQNFFRVQVYRNQNVITRSGRDYFGEIKGGGDWQTFRLRIPKGATRVRWVYFNRDENSQGLLDHMRLEQATVDPAILSAMNAIFLALIDDD